MSACQADVALEQVVGARGERLQHVAVADDLGRGAVAHAHVDAEHAVDDEHAGAMADLPEAAGEVAIPGRRREHDRGHDLPGHEPHAQVELLGEVVVEIEQVAVGRGRERVDARQLAQRRPLLGAPCWRLRSSGDVGSSRARGESGRARDLGGRRR